MTHDPRRRDILRWMAASAAGATLAAAAEAKPRRPNILFILTDDQRWDALGCMGHPFLKTPNMDRLAKEGALFENAFVTTSLCSPSRASFLTGCYAHTHGVHANIGRDPDPKLPTFPQLLQKAGYATAFVGKWHMAAKDSPRPGFDHWVSFRGQGKYYNCTMNVDGKPHKATKYTADELADFAVAWLTKPRTKPFCLTLSHKAVHAPFSPAKRHATLYQDAEIKSHHQPNDRLDDKVPWGRKMPANWQSDVRSYHQALASVDENLGRVLKTLEELGVLDDTAIVFAGDNGYFHGEHGGLWDKRAAYEPAMRIPLLMRYPPLIKPGTRPKALALNIDLAPTLLELAGVAPPKTMQGRSWLPALAGRDEGRESFLYEYFREGDPRFNRPSTFAVRTRRWKYIEYPEHPKVIELYDIGRDPHELNNLAADPAHAVTLKTLRAEMARLKKQTGFRMPPGQAGGRPGGRTRKKPAEQR